MDSWDDSEPIELISYTNPPQFKPKVGEICQIFLEDWKCVLCKIISQDTLKSYSALILNQFKDQILIVNNVCSTDIKPLPFPRHQ